MPPHSFADGYSLNADEPTHRRMRRLLAHAFSEKALTAQEDILTDYISQFVNGLKRECSSSREGKVNIAQWYNFTTFDVIGDLSFGEPFGCVKHAEYHPWVYDMLGHFKMLSAIRLARMFPLISIPLMMLMPSSLKKNRKAHLQWAIDKVNKRIEMGDRRQSPDFMHYLLRHNDEKGMTHDEIRDLAGTLVIAGSETVSKFWLSMQSIS